MKRLSAHPAIAAYGELLLPRTGYPVAPPGANDRPFYETYLHERGIPTSRVQRHLHLFGFLDYLYAPRNEASAVGFKLMYSNASPYPEVLAYFHRRAVCVVHLVRANLLDIVLSQMSLRYRRSAIAWSPSERDDVRVPVDTATLHRRLRRIERDRAIARRVLQASRVSVHEMTYEDLLVSDRPLYSALDFLGVSNPAAYPLATTMVKLAPVSHRAGIANYEAVDVSLRGTRFHRFLRPD
jgi:hypothetical protein